MFEHQVPRKYFRVAAATAAISLLYIALRQDGSRSIAQQQPAQYEVILDEINNEQLLVLIQDEHQNVLPHWHEVATRKGISSFVLIHVDAHSDMACPEKYTRTPATKHDPPFTRENMRTSNDEFIEDAIHSELIDAVVWVVPDWGQANEYDMFEGHWDNGRISPEDAAIAVGYLLDVDGSQSMTPCDCIVLGDWRHHLEDTEKVCSSFDDDELDEAHCKLTRTVPLEVLVGSKFASQGITVLQEMETPRIILDVDEDYFATSDALAPLVSAGWDNRSLGMIDHILSHICAPSEMHEDALDKLLRDFLSGKFENALVNALIKPGPIQDRSVLDSFLCAKMSPLYRKRERDSNVLIDSLSAQRNEIQKRLGPIALLKLIETGFCVIPRSEREVDVPEFPAPMSICVGVDQVRRGPQNSRYYTNTMVMHHVPDPEQLEDMLIELRGTLASFELAQYIEVVTIVRSIRDGYLPRRLWETVEKHILETVKQMRPDAKIVMDGRMTWN